MSIAAGRSCRPLGSPLIQDDESPEPGQTALLPDRWLGRSGNGEASSEEERLNRALVAGLILEVILEHPRLLEDPGSRRYRVKACLKTTLVSRLAGRIPLAAFRNLAQGLDGWFEDFYPLLFHYSLLGDRPQPSPPPSPAGGAPIREDRFRECLGNFPDLLPRRRHRKLDREKLRDFLEQTGGNWFKLRDFEAYFQVDRKTAWEYVRKLLQAAILLHNQGHSSAVRYRVAPQLLSIPPKSGMSATPATTPSGVQFQDGGVPFHL